MFSKIRTPLVGTALVIGLVATASGAEPPAKPVGIGIIGDSYSDEYQFYGPDRMIAKNWVEILDESRGLDFGSFSLEDRGAPRHSGFAYNWARSDATTSDAIAEGQHLGLKAQLDSGQVDLVFIFLGGNDYLHALRETNPVGALKELGSTPEANLKTILETLLDTSNDVRFVLATVPDVGNIPEFVHRLESGKLSAPAIALARADLKQYNAAIRKLARENPRIALLDLEFQTRLATFFFSKSIRFAGTTVELEEVGNTPDHFFLKDQLHAGTIGQGIIAQRFIQTANSQLGFSINPLSDEDIRSIAWSSNPSKSIDREIMFATVVTERHRSSMKDSTR